MKIYKSLLFLTLAALLVFPTFAYAEVTPYADPEFHEVFISFYSDGEADFECVTYERKASLCVKDCQLQKKDGNTWVDVGKPTTGVILSNASSYSHTIDYSGKIDSGTYRVKGTFVADGYTRTKYSAARTF